MKCYGTILKIRVNWNVGLAALCEAKTQHSSRYSALRVHDSLGRCCRWVVSRAPHGTYPHCISGNVNTMHP